MVIAFTGLKAQEPFPDTMTVDQVIQMVLANHPAIKQADHLVAASQARVSQTRGSYYPDITGQGLYNIIGPVPGIEFGGNTIDLAPRNNWDFHIGLRQNVYDFGRRPTSVELAKSATESASENVNLTRQNLALRTVETFYLILLLEQNVQVLDEEIAALDQHLQAVQKKVSAGTATDFDVLTTQVRIANTQNQKIDIINALNKQRDILGELAGLTTGQDIEIKGDFNVSPLDINADSLISLAYDQLPEARLSYNREIMAELQYRLADKGYWPILSASFEFGLKNGYPSNLNKLMANWVAGVQLQVPIFNGFMTRYNKAAASEELSAAKEGTQSIKRQINSQVQQAIDNYDASLQKVQTSEVQVEQAQAAVAIAKSRYDAGVITNLDLLDAQTSLAYAKLIHLQAMYGVVSSQYALNRAIGNKFWE